MARDEEFARWYRAHHPRICTLCARILRDHAAAEDMAQEALLRAWTRRGQMREEDLGAWLSVVARNLCLSALRRDGRIIPTDELPERVDHGADPALEVGRRESRRNVRRALGKLGDRNKRVIYLREVREADYEEIGSELGITAEGARTIAFRARRVLREHLAAVGEGCSGVLLGVRVRIRSASVRIRNAISEPASASTAFSGGLGVLLAAGMLLQPTPSSRHIASPSHRPHASSVAVARSAPSLAAVERSERGLSAEQDQARTRTSNDLNVPGIDGGRPTLDREGHEIHWWTRIEDPLGGTEIEYRGTGEGDNQIVFPALNGTFLLACEAAPEECEQLDELLAGGD